MTTTEVLLEKLMEMEGCRLEAYEDAAGVPTIGYGHTKNVRMGDKFRSTGPKRCFAKTSRRLNGR